MWDNACYSQFCVQIPKNFATSRSLIHMYNIQTFYSKEKKTKSI